MDRETAVKVGNIHAVIAGLKAEIWAETSKEVKAAINFIYEDEVQKLRELLGPHELCILVDPWLWQNFSDAYKDKHGVRPRGEYTVDETQSLLANLNK